MSTASVPRRTLLRRRWLAPLAAALLATLACEPPPDEVERQEQAAATDMLVTPKPVYAGVYSVGTAPQVVQLGRTETEFLADYGVRWNSGDRLVTLASHVMDGQIRYSGAWFSYPHPQYLILNRTHDQFVSYYNDRINEGFRLASFTTCVLNGVTYYSGIFNPGSGNHFLGLARTGDQFLADYGTNWNAGRRLVAMSSSVVNGQARFSGVWAPSTSGQFLAIGRDVSGFAQDFVYWYNQGFRLRSITTYVANDTVFYNGLWNATSIDSTFDWGSPENDFMQIRQTMADSNYRLIHITTSHVEALALNRLTSAVRDAIAPNAVGVAVTADYGSSRSSHSAGLRRTSADWPQTNADVTSRFNSASVTKTITAIAVMQLLRDRGISRFASVSDYLPKDWVRGPGTLWLTFDELLSHRSGLGTTDGTSYSYLRNLIAAGTGPTQGGAPLYRNHNYALFRIIIPYLRGFSETGVTDKDLALSNAYVQYLNDGVFRPAGLGTIDVKPSSFQPTLAYPLPAGSTNGVTFGDWTRQTGGGGLHLSATDIATVLRKRNDGTILDSTSRSRMDNSRYGWDFDPADPARTVRHGYALSKGGFLSQNVTGGQANANTLAVNFTSGAVLGLLVNSRTTTNTLNAVINAYETAWVPLY
jgi:CubicO group peptidase (beta-lactamase class C family)